LRHAVFGAQQVLEQDLDGLRKAGDIQAALLQRVVAVLAAAGGESGSGSKTIRLWHLFSL
jgi:hypothetical protein